MKKVQICTLLWKRKVLHVKSGEIDKFLMRSVKHFQNYSVKTCENGDLLVWNRCMLAVKGFCEIGGQFKFPSRVALPSKVPISLNAEDHAVLVSIAFVSNIIQLQVEYLSIWQVHLFGVVSTLFKLHALTYIFRFSHHNCAQVGLSRKTPKVGQFHVDWLQPMRVLVLHFGVHSDLILPVVIHASNFLFSGSKYSSFDAFPKGVVPLVPGFWCTHLWKACIYMHHDMTESDLEQVQIVIARHFGKIHWKLTKKKTLFRDSTLKVTMMKRTQTVFMKKNNLWSWASAIPYRLGLFSLRVLMHTTMSYAVYLNIASHILEWFIHTCIKIYWDFC